MSIHSLPFGRGSSLQRGHRRRSSQISSGTPQHSPTGYPTGYTPFTQQQAPVGSTAERHGEHRRAADGQSLNGLSVVQQRQQMTGYPTQQQQYQGQTRAHWLGSGAHQTNAPVPQPSQPPFGYPPFLTRTGHSHDHAHAHAHTNANAHMPTRNPSVHVPLPPTAHSQRTNDSSTQLQEQYYYIPEYNTYPQPAQTQAYGQQPYTPPTRTSPPEGFALINDPISYVPSHPAHTNLTAFGENPNPRAWPSGSGVSIGDGPTSPNPRAVRSNGDRTIQAQELNPTPRSTPCTALRPRPVSYESDLVRLQQRCREKGADESLIALLGKIFANDVSLEALIRPLTDAEAETKEFGIETGKVYTAFLGYANEEEGVPPRYICRLCHGTQTWKHSKDVLRHLRRDHFGLADVCGQWYVSIRSLTLASINVLPGEYSNQKFYTRGELTRHPCKPAERTQNAGSA